MEASARYDCGVYLIVLVSVYNRPDFLMKRTEMFDNDIMDLAREKIKASSLGVARVPVPVLAPVAGQVSV